MLWPKINSYKEFDNEKKNSYGSKIPLPTPITFLMVRPLTILETWDETWASLYLRRADKQTHLLTSNDNRLWSDSNPLQNDS